MFKQLSLSKSTDAKIEWDMTPDLAFCTFSAKGMRDELTNTSERICYFFIDNWGDAPKLYLMERGTRHVHILAEINAPRQMMVDCIVRQGGTPTSRDNYPVDAPLKEWLLTEVVEVDNSPFLIPAVPEEIEKEDMGTQLPAAVAGITSAVCLPSAPCSLDDNRVQSSISQWNFFDTLLNPEGSFANALADRGDTLTVIDQATNIIWQRTGLDLCSIRSMKAAIEQLNSSGFAGYNDWRLPTVEEAMSLMEPAANSKGMHLHPCFSREQPFIFVNARRKPTGYWFVDYTQGKIYWSSGTVPGGFARLCRTAD